MKDSAELLAVVTGANSGVGRSAAELLAAAGASVVMVCRSEDGMWPPGFAIGQVRSICSSTTPASTGPGASCPRTASR